MQLTRLEIWRTNRNWWKDTSGLDLCVERSPTISSLSLQPFPNFSPRTSPAHFQPPGITRIKMMAERRICSSSSGSWGSKRPAEGSVWSVVEWCVLSCGFCRQSTTILLLEPAHCSGEVLQTKSWWLKPLRLVLSRWGNQPGAAQPTILLLPLESLLLMHHLLPPIVLVRFHVRCSGDAPTV